MAENNTPIFFPEVTKEGKIHDGSDNFLSKNNSQEIIG